MVARKNDHSWEGSFWSKVLYELFARMIVGIDPRCTTVVRKHTNSKDLKLLLFNSAARLLLSSCESNRSLPTQTRPKRTLQVIGPLMTETRFQLEAMACDLRPWHLYLQFLRQCSTEQSKQSLSLAFSVQYVCMYVLMMTIRMTTPRFAGSHDDRWHPLLASY